MIDLYLQYENKLLEIKNLIIEQVKNSFIEYIYK